MPFLEEAEPQAPALASRLAKIQEEIHFSCIQEEFRALASSRIRGDIDLEAGAFLIAKSAYPDLNVEHYTQLIDGIAEEVRPQLTESWSIQQKNPGLQ